MANLPGVPQQEVCLLDNNDDVSNGWLPDPRYDLFLPSRI